MDIYKNIDNYKIVDVDRIDRTPYRMNDNSRVIIKETEILQAPSKNDTEIDIFYYL